MEKKKNCKTFAKVTIIKIYNFFKNKRKKQDSNLRCI